MNGRNLYSYLFVWLCICSLTTYSIAQTITTGSITPSTICPGGAVTVTFTTSGTFAASNTFSAQLSDAAGTFPTTPTIIGSVTSTTAGSINATIPASVANGSYKIRVVSSAATVIGTPGTQGLTVNVPVAPGTSAISYCIGQTASALTATAAGGATLNWYGTSATGGTASAISPTPSTTAVGSTTYYVSQSVNGCEGPRASLVVTVNNAPAAPTTTVPAPYCQNIPASALTASGTGLKWYDASNNLLPGAPTPNTGTPGSTTYSVSQSIGSCESPKTPIVVVVNAAPGVPATTPAPTYCQNAPAVPLIATPSANGTLNWYGTAATGGIVSTSATPNTSVLGTTNYYVSQTVGGCESPRASIAVTVNSTPASPSVAPVSFCLNSPAGALTASPSPGGSLNWYGTSPTGGTASAVSPTPSTTAVGSVTYYVSQSVNGCEGPRTGIVVTVNSIPVAPTATAPAPYCQGAPATALTASGTGLRWYDSSNNLLNVAPTPNTNSPGTTNYYVSQTVNGCESARTAIPVMVNAAPVAPATTPAPTYCQNQPAVALVATPSANGTLNWYNTAATGGPVSATANIPSTSQPGTTNYYVSQTVGGCESPRAAIAVTVNSIPASPSVAPVSFCLNSPASALTASPSSGGSLNWYGTSATGGTASAISPTPSTTAVGSTTYYVSQSVNGCEGPRTSLVVTINSIPSAPTATVPTPYCQAAPAAVLIATGQNLRWYGTNATGGIGDGTAPIPNTSAPGTTNYYVSQTVNGCESGRTAIPVSVKSTPVAPGTSDVAFCQGAGVPLLTVTLVPNATPNWYGTNPTSGTATATAPVPSNATPGTTVYYVSQTLDGCESPRASLSVRVKAIPAAPGVAAISFCNNGPASQLNANGASLKWYDASDNFLSGGAPTPSTTTVGDQVYKVSQTIESCEGPKATLTVTTKPLPTSPTGNTPAPYCQGAPATALSASGTGLLWYGPSQTGGSASASATIPSTAAPGNTTYYVTQTVNGCESARAGITVSVKPKPGLPTTSAIAFCQGSTPPTLSASFATGATPNWYGTNPVSGTATATAPTLPSTNPGTTLYYVSQTVDGCESDRAGLSVRVKALPAVPVVTPIGFCNTSVASALTATGTDLKWYGATDNLLGGAPTPGTTTVGDQVYKVSQTIESCEGPKATLTVTIKPLPVAPPVKDLTYCLQTQDQPAQNVAPLNAFGENLKWYNANNSFTTVAPTPTISQTGVQSYIVSQTFNGCEGPRSTLQVSVGTTSIPTVAKSLVTYCINDKSVPLEATATNGGSLRWIDPYNVVSNEAPTPYTLNTSVQAGGDPFYVYQIGTNSCYSPRATIKVLVNALPTLSLIAANPNINLGQRVNLQLKFTSVAPFSYTLTNGLSGVVNKSDTTLSLLPSTTTTYQIVTVRNSCGVGLPGNPATATIAVRIPTVTTSALASSTLCAGTSLAVPFTTTGEFNQGNLFRIELVSVADTSKKLAIPATATASPITAPLPLTLVGGQYYVRVKADNPEIGIIGSNSPTLLTVRPQATATLTGTQNIYEGFPANLTLTFGGESPWMVTYADSVRSYSATATTSPYTIEVRPSRTTTYRLVSVTSGCGNGPASGTATVTVLPLLSVDDNPLDPLVKTYPVPTTSVLTVELDLPLTHDPATLILTDMSGRPVLKQTTRNRKQELDLTAQPNGLYLLYIQVGERQTVRKVLKQ